MSHDHLKLPHQKHKGTHYANTHLHYRRLFRDEKKRFLYGYV